MPTIYKQITTPSGAKAPVLVAKPNKVTVTAGASAGVADNGQKAEVHHGDLTATEAVAIPANSTAFVFVAQDGSAAYLDASPDGKGLPVTLSGAFRIGRAWKAGDGKFVKFQGTRVGGTTTYVAYNVDGGPKSRTLLDKASTASPTTQEPFPPSPFLTAGGITLNIDVTVKGGNAKVFITDGATAVVKEYGEGKNQPDQIVYNSPGGKIAFTTDAGATITILVDAGVETP